MPPLTCLTVIGTADPVFGAAVAENLRALGHQVAAIGGSGVETVEIALKNGADFVVLDIHLPLLGGMGAILDVLKPHRIPVLACSGAADESAARRAAELDVVAYIVSPFTQAELELALHVAITRSEQRGL